jgi:hypothetical protein
MFDADLPEEVVWAPQPGPQAVLCKCPAPEIFFGGSRGGGKTDGVLGRWAAKEAQWGPNFNAMMFRRTTVSSTDAIDRSKEIYRPLGGVFNESKLTWRLPHGGRAGFGYLDSIDDAGEYQGRNLTDAWIEEAGQYPSPEPIFRLFGALRSSAGVPVQIILTGNPGGPGQTWIRERYEMVPFPRWTRILVKDLPNGTTHQVAVIPSRLLDNQILMQRDPGYASRLTMVGNPALVRAWLEGDWNAIEGAFFAEWDEGRHVIAPFAVPEHWLRFRSMDWGSASPFSVGWWAVASDDHVLSAGGLGRLAPGLGAGERRIPRGAIVRYREWYGAAKIGETWVGLKLPNELIGAGIIEREKGERIAYGVLDPSCFNQSGGPSIYEQMRQGARQAGGSLLFREADNTRAPKRGAISGWGALRARLVGTDEAPMLFCFDSCKALIRTLPLMEHDHDRPEDIDTDAEDHAVDECRYACLSRPWIKPLPRIEKPVGMKGYSVSKPTRERLNVTDM